MGGICTSLSYPRGHRKLMVASLGSARVIDDVDGDRAGKKRSVTVTCSKVPVVSASTKFNGMAQHGQHSMVNVVIQLLYHISAFRRVVVRATPASINSSATAVKTLKRAFYDLENSQEPVSLGELTQLLDWDHSAHHGTTPSSYDISTLLTHMKILLGDPLSTDIHSLFDIIERTYLHSYTPLFGCSNRVEHLYSTLVDVRDHKTLHESLKKYLQPNPIYEQEKLESNCTRTIEHLPPVWMIDLRRHYHSQPSGYMVIYRHRYKFPEKLDASAYLSNFANYSEPWRYGLHGVVVYEKKIGEKGRYSLYFRPCPEMDTWYHFTDEHVEEVPSMEVLGGNFGLGRHDELVKMKDWNNTRGNWRYPRMAQTLIYVRESRLNDVFGSSNS